MRYKKYLIYKMEAPQISFDILALIIDEIPIRTLIGFSREEDYKFRETLCLVNKAFNYLVNRRLNNNGIRPFGIPYYEYLAINSRYYFSHITSDILNGKYRRHHMKHYYKARGLSEWGVDINNNKIIKRMAALAYLDQSGRKLLPGYDYKIDRGLVKKKVKEARVGNKTPIVAIRLYEKYIKDQRRLYIPKFKYFLKLVKLITLLYGPWTRTNKNFNDFYGNLMDECERDNMLKQQDDYYELCEHFDVMMPMYDPVMGLKCDDCEQNFTHIYGNRCVYLCADCHGPSEVARSERFMEERNRQDAYWSEVAMTMPESPLYEI